MVDIISDATATLEAELNKFKSLVDQGRDKAYTTLDESLTAATQKLDELPTKFSKYLQDNPVKSYVDGSVFRDLIGAAKTAYSTEVSNMLNDVTTGYTTAKSNVSIDFQKALNDAQVTLINDISTKYISDTEFQTKYDKTQKDMTDYIKSTSDLISARSTDNDAKFTSARGNSQTISEDLFNQFENSRPLVRDVGNIVSPHPVNFGSDNEFSIDLKNIGGKLWEGFIGLVLQDQYYKRLVMNDAVQIFQIPPGQTMTLKQSFNIPKAISVTDKNTGQSVMRNWGNELSYKIRINTRSTAG
jgi:hypothetical protein